MVICAVFGVALGTHFKVQVLFPTIFLAAVVVGGISLAHGNSASATAIAIVFATTALQLGFLIGSIARFLLASLKAPHRERDSAASVAPPAGPPRTLFEP
jgi:hypothetical protein